MLERVVDVFAREPNGGLMVLPDVSTINRDLIIATTCRRSTRFGSLPPSCDDWARLEGDLICQRCDEGIKRA